MGKLSIALWMLWQVQGTAAMDTNVTGTWAISGDVSGVQVTETCVLKQSTDSKISGTCQTVSGKFDVTGTTEKQTATFRHGGSYEGNPLVITYTGKLGSDGAMTGTIYVDAYDATGSFTARKTATATN